MTRVRYAFPILALAMLASHCPPQTGGGVGPAIIAAASPQPVAVVTHHNDNARTGVNAKEQILTPENVRASSGQFQLLYKIPVSGQVYAQPLFVPGVRQADGALHNLLIVATEMNQLSVWDQQAVEDAAAAGSASMPTASVFVLGTPVPHNFMPMAYTTLCGVILCATSNPPNTPTTAWSDGFPYNMWPSIGVTSTPVVDTTTLRLYVVAKSLLPTSATTIQLNCFDLATLRACPGSPVTIAGSVATMLPTPPGAPPITGTRTFDPKMHLQRSALLLSSGQVYIAFGSHADTPPWNGWVFAYNAATLQQTAVWCSTPNGAGGSIWQAGGGPAADEAGNLYFMTGNGAVMNPATDFPMSFIKLTPALTLAASFRTGNAELNDKDVDLGSSGPVLIGANTIIGGDKTGTLYNLDRALTLRQRFQAALPLDWMSARGSGFHHIHGVPVVWRDPAGMLRAYLWAERDKAKAFAWNDNTSMFDMTPVLVSDVSSPGYHGPLLKTNMPGGAASLSANGSKPGTAILWVSMNRDDDALQAVVAGVLRAFDPENLQDELWNSDMNTLRDSVGRYGKYVPPTVTNGRVFLATFSNAVNVYGLRQGATFVEEQTAPVSVKAGETFSLWVLLENSGFTAWRTADRYALGFPGPTPSPWGTSRIALPKDVGRYETALITINVTAPSTPGTFPFQWRMVQDIPLPPGTPPVALMFFGDLTRRLMIKVVP